MAQTDPNTEFTDNNAEVDNSIFSDYDHEEISYYDSEEIAAHSNVDGKCCCCKHS